MADVTAPADAALPFSDTQLRAQLKQRVADAGAEIEAYAIEHSEDASAAKRLVAETMHGAATIRASSGTDGKFAAPRRASEIESKAIDWLWQGFLPLGALSLLYGPEGGGKSVLTAMIAARASLGTLAGALDGKPTSVEIIAYEDDPSAVLIPRLEAAGADMNRVFIHGGELDDEVLTLPDDAAGFGEALRSRGSKLVIVDPLTDALREGLKDNNNGDVRKALQPLNAMAQSVGAAILGITHPNKGATNAADKVMGSRAWRSVPRSVILYGHDPDDLAGETRIAVVSKANYARKAAVKIRVQEVSVAVAGRQCSQPRAEIVGESRHTDADVILANAGATRPDGEQLSKQEQGEALIYRLLEDGGGEIEAKVAYAAGFAAGVPEATMRRARQAVGASEGKTWALPEGLPL
jgi:hypothetical protein